MAQDSRVYDMKMNDKKFYENPPPWIHEISICTDSACLHKELQVGEKDIPQRSRPEESIYYKEDFFSEVTNEEMQKWNIQE